MTAAPFVSVIVPVFNDADRLRLCLQALERQTYPQSLYEIIVVDNGSDESVDAVVAPFGGVRLCSEERPGSYAARNRGLALARGEVIAFTDADCVPSQVWIEKGVETLLGAPGCGLVAGRVEVFAADPRRATAVELYEMATYLQQKRYVERDRFGATANLFTRRSVFERVGEFDAGMMSGGDVEWGRRVASNGYALLYSDEALVKHPARCTYAQLYRRVARITGGACALKKTGARSLLAGLLPPVRYSLTVWREARLKNLKDRSRIVCVIFFVRYAETWAKLRLLLGSEPRR